MALTSECWSRLERVTHQSLSLPKVSLSGPSYHPALGFCAFFQHLAGKYIFLGEKKKQFGKKKKTF